MLTSYITMIYLSKLRNGIDTLPHLSLDFIIFYTGVLFLLGSVQNTALHLVASFPSLLWFATVFQKVLRTEYVCPPEFIF